MADSQVCGGAARRDRGVPGQHRLRLHLAELLVEDDPAGALEQCTAILSREPDHAGALDLAATASSSAGDTDRAEWYRRMADALGSNRLRS